MKRIAQLSFRAALARLLAVIYTRPDADRLLEIRRTLRRFAENHHSPLLPNIKRLQAAFTTASDLELAHEYRRLFGIGGAVSLNETTYNGTERLARRAVRLADIQGVYRALNYRGLGHDSELPDHLCVELGFVDHLLRKEAYALTHGLRSQVTIAHQFERFFLRQHLGLWLPALTQAVASAAGTDTPYRQSTELLTKAVALEYRRHHMNTSPAKRPEISRHSAVPI